MLYHSKSLYSQAYGLDADTFPSGPELVWNSRHLTNTSLTVKSHAFAATLLLIMPLHMAALN